MTGSVVRDARRSDIVSVGALWQEMMDLHFALDPRFRFHGSARRDYERHVASMLHATGARVLVAASGEIVIGYAIGEVHVRRPVYPAGTYGLISDVCVGAEWRRQGVGRALVGEMLAWLRTRGVTAIELYVSEANGGSEAFWRAMGFTSYLRVLRMDMEGTG